MLWLGVAVGVTPMAMKLGDYQQSDGVVWLPHSAEATEAFNRVEQQFPGLDAHLAVVVYNRASGVTAADAGRVEQDRAAFLGFARDGAIPPAVKSQDGKALLLAFSLAGDEDAQAANSVTIKKHLADAPGDLRSALGGSSGAGTDIDEAFSGMEVTVLIATGSIVALLLLITYRSPILWAVPLFAVALASQVATAVVYLLARYADLTVDPQSRSIFTVLVFGVGTDYALLLIGRYREELRRHPDRHRAMGAALRASFGAILASAATVTAALLCMLFAQLNSNRSLGAVGAVGIVTALVAMTTLLPALLLVLGRWVFWPFVPRYTENAPAPTAQHRIYGGLARFVGRRPRAVWIGTAVVLAAMVFGATNLHLGLPSTDYFADDVGSVRAQKMIDQHFPGGSTGPAQIIATTGSASAVATAAGGVPGVASVQAPLPSADGRWVAISAVLTDPPASAAAQRTVERLRDAVHAVPGSDAVVGGMSAVELDTATAAERDDFLIMPLILGVVLLVLILLLRALVAPILLILSVVLSFAAALGLTGFILHALGYANISYGMPLEAFLFLVALGVDYTIFLMTRAREESRRMGTRRGVLHALTVTGGVITSAGLVLAATFSTFIALPLVPSIQIGIFVAVGILLDTFIVRTLLIPALAVHIGPRIWWPSRLSRESPAQSAPAAARPPLVPTP
ncbi:MMPL family transporter [Micromonospora sp. CPCC 205711]